MAAGADDAAHKNSEKGNAPWPWQDCNPAASGYSAELDEAERASRDEIMALQTKRLAWSLRHAYDNVAHYRKAFDAAGVHPSDFKQLSDLAKFPFTVKTDLRDNYPFNMFAVPREKLVRVHASSGTTGKPIVVGYTQGDIDIWSDVMARSIRAAGGRTGMMMHNAYGYGLFTGGLGAHYGAERLGCTVVPVSGGMTERQVQLINDFKPDIITVTPSYMLAILDEFKRQGLDPRKSSLKFGIFGAEPWTNAMRAEIEQAFDMDATDIYGLSEVIGPGVAQECVETKDGLHIWEDHFYPEVIDPETGAVLPDGEKGELVFTSLTKEGFPIIRYRTRDLTRLLPGTARPGMRRMEKVTGRSDDMIILRGVNVFPTQIEEALLATDWCGGHFIIELTREGRMDEMTVLAEARPEQLGRQRPARACRKGLGLHQEHHRHHRAHQGRRARHAGTFARQGETCLRQAAERVTPAPQTREREGRDAGCPKARCPAVTVEARCVRLPAKAADAAALAPVVETRALSRGRQRTADRGQGRGRQSVRREGRDRADALCGVSAHAGPRLCGRRDRRPDGLDRARGVRLVRRSRHPPRRHPCHASRGRGRRRGGEAQRAFPGRRPPASACPLSPRWKACAAPAFRRRARPCW